VDDFGIKYVDQEHAQHIVDASGTLYKLTTDWDGSLYCGITLKWDYIMRTVDLSMPGYLGSALHKFQHLIPHQLEHVLYT
jgi:endonuclease I